MRRCRLSTTDSVYHLLDGDAVTRITGGGRLLAGPGAHVDAGLGRQQIVDLGADPSQALGSAGLAADCEGGRGVRVADQRPAVAEVGARAVDVDDRVFRRELIPQRGDNLELLIVRAAQLDQV